MGPVSPSTGNGQASGEIELREIEYPYSMKEICNYVR